MLYMLAISRQELLFIILAFKCVQIGVALQT